MGAGQNDTTSTPKKRSIIKDLNRKGELKKEAYVPPDLEKYEHLRITSSTPIPIPIFTIMLDNELVSSQGNVTTISGGVKAGKSAVTGVILAGALSETGESVDGFPRLRVAPNPSHRAVIHIDTEQSKYKHQKNIKSVLARLSANDTPKHLLSYNVRGMQVLDCQTFLKEIFQAAASKFNGIHLIVIDGIADFINDVNDSVAAFEIIQLLMNLSEEFATSIIVIIHTNPNSEKERGTLGSICLRKSESILTIKKDGDISSLETKYMRESHNLPPMQFIYDKDRGYHICCDAVEYREAKSMDKDAMKLAAIEKIAATVFAPPSALDYKAAIDAIMKHSKKAVATAKGLFTTMRVHEFIIQGNDNNWRLKMKDGTNVF